MSKTVVVGWVSIAAGMLSTVGVDLPVEAIEAAVGSIFDNAVAGYMAISGAVMIWLRKMTSGPVADGVKGILGIKD